MKCSFPGCLVTDAERWEVMYCPNCGQWFCEEHSDLEATGGIRLVRDPVKGKGRFEALCASCGKAAKS